jgi:hypothetical protein
MSLAKQAAQTVLSPVGVPAILEQTTGARALAAGRTGVLGPIKLPTAANVSGQPTPAPNKTTGTAEDGEGQVAQGPVQQGAKTLKPGTTIKPIAQSGVTVSKAQPFKMKTATSPIPAPVQSALARPGISSTPAVAQNPTRNSVAATPRVPVTPRPAAAPVAEPIQSSAVSGSRR